MHASSPFRLIFAIIYTWLSNIHSIFPVKQNILVFDLLISRAIFFIELYTLHLLQFIQNLSQPYDIICIQNAHVYTSLKYTSNFATSIPYMYIQKYIKYQMDIIHLCLLYCLILNQPLSSPFIFILALLHHTLLLLYLSTNFQLDFHTLSIIFLIICNKFYFSQSHIFQRTTKKQQSSLLISCPE